MIRTESFIRMKGQRCILEINNSPDAVELRRRQNVLLIGGAGTILFSVWTIVKSVGLMLPARENYLPGLIKPPIYQGNTD